MNKLNTSVFLYLLARLWSVDLQDQNPLLIMKKVQKCVLFGVIWVVYSFHNPVFTYGQTTIWLPKVDRTESELTYTYSVQAPDYLADWILNTPAAGSGELIQKTVDGKNYTVIKRIATWDLGGSHPEKTGQIRFDTKLGDMDGTWKFEPKLKDESQVIQALNSAVPPTDGPWKSAIILALKWEGTTLPTLKFTEKISQLDQAKARMVNIAKNTKAGKFYPEVKVPVDVAGYRAAMLEIVNLARKDPDYRSKNKFASNLRDDIAQTTSSQRQKIYHNSPTSSLFDDLQLDDKLNDLAQIQAEWAAKNNYMGHNGPPNYNGVTMVDFGQRTQYFTPGYISAGEAGGWATSPEDWMQGETHFRPWFSIGHDVDFIGFGVAIGGDGKLRAFGVATSTRPHTAAAESKSYTFNLPLASGALMEREKKYISDDGRTYMMWPKDGNLGVLLDRSKEPVKENDIMLWSVATSNLKISPWQVASVRISAAANLEVVDKDGKILWTSSSQKPKLDQNGLSQEPIVFAGSRPLAQAVAQTGSTTSPATPGGPSGGIPAAANTATLKYQTRMNLSDKLLEGEKVVSANGKYQLRGTSEGGFVIEEVQNSRVAYTFPATSSIGNPPSVSFLSYNLDGNVVINNKQSKAYYATTGNDAVASVILHKSDHAELTDDGRFILVDSKGEEIWATEAGARRASSSAPNPNAKKGTTTNLAVGQPARQSSDFNTQFAGAEKAVDGGTEATFKFAATNSISHTKDENSPWWEVDLGAVYDIKTVVVHNRLDCCWERLDDYIVTISENPIRLRSSTDYAGVPTSDPTTPNITGVGTWSDVLRSQSLGDLGRRGRYVRITLPQGKAPRALNLTEVQVWGQ